MREIKFRIWCKKTEEMHAVERMGFEEGELWYVEDEGRETQPPYFMDRNDSVLMQFTGLKDKNGREIYEGDIVKIVSHTVGFMDGLRKSEIPKVKYRRIGWHPKGSWNSYKNLSDEHIGIVSVFQPEVWCEVVGNIYENTELLDGEKFIE